MRNEKKMKRWKYKFTEIEDIITCGEWWLNLLFDALKGPFFVEWILMWKFLQKTDCHSNFLHSFSQKKICSNFVRVIFIYTAKINGCMQQKKKHFVEKINYQLQFYLFLSHPLNSIKTF